MKPRRRSIPGLIRWLTVPEIGIAERQAIAGLKAGWADYHNSYHVLADCHGLLTLGLRHKKDQSLEGVVQLGLVAMTNIFDRYQRTKKIGATGEELAALELLVDCAEDFWKRQSTGLMDQCIAELKQIRRKQHEPE